MKVKVKVEDHYYEVDILDLRTRPVIAIVDGQEFEVWPEDASALPTAQLSNSGIAEESKTAPAAAPVSAKPVAPSASSAKVLNAPIPGVVVAIKVKPGDEVTNGQELLVLEAMKMRNAIRSARAGKIVAVHVTTGQTVNHGEPLLEYSD